MTTTLCNGLMNAHMNRVINRRIEMKHIDKQVALELWHKQLNDGFVMACKFLDNGQALYEQSFRDWLEENQIEIE